jgi:hypothetical protein
MRAATRSRLAGPDRALRAVPNTLSLRLFPDPPVIRNGVPAPISSSWLSHAFDWLRQEAPELESLSVLDGLIDEPVDLAEAAAFMERARARKAMTALVMAGRPDRIVVAVGGYFAISASVCLSVAGPALDDESLIERAARLEQIARDLAAEVSHAVIDVEPSLGLVLGLYPAATIWRNSDGAQPTLVYHLCDELLFDAYPFQVLGPGHLQPCLLTNSAASDLFHARWPGPSASANGQP